MTEAVNDVIAQRAHDPRGLQRTMTASFAIHIGMVVLVGVLLRGWLTTSDAARTMMTISLGVSAGARATGMTAIGGRPVERVEKLKTLEPIRPATPKSEVAMNVAPKTRPAPTTGAEATPPPPASTATSGAELRPGSSLVETGARGEGVGLTFGGGPGLPTMSLGVDFCCPDYAQRIVSIISSRWQSAQPEKGRTVIVFTIHADGRVTDARVESSSGSFLLDQKSRLAIPPALLSLPAEYTKTTLTVHLTFPYGGS